MTQAAFTPNTTILDRSEARSLTSAALNNTKTAEAVLKDIEKYITAAANQGRDNVTYTILEWEIDDDTYYEVCNTLDYFSYGLSVSSSGDYIIFEINWENNPV